MIFIKIFMTLLTFLVLIKQLVGKKQFVLLMNGVIYHPYVKKTYLGVNIVLVLLSLFFGMLTFAKMYVYENYNPYTAFLGSSLIPIASIMLLYNSCELMKENKRFKLKKKSKKKSKTK